MHTVLVIGGYRFFGAGISGAVAKNPAIRLLIGGRSRDKACRMAQELGASHEQGISIDAEKSGLEQTLKELGVDTVVHTAGPFQGQVNGRKTRLAGR